MNREQNLLYDYCKWGWEEKTKQLLSRNNIGLDVLSSDGLYFWLAAQHEDLAVATSIIGALLDYYAEKYLQGDHDSIEYKLNRHKLQEVLIEQFEDADLPQEISDLLKPYIGDIINRNDEDTDQDLSDELDMLELSTNSTNSPESIIWLGVDHDQDHHDHLLHNHNIAGPGTNLLGNHSTIHTQ